MSSKQISGWYHTHHVTLWIVKYMQIVKALIPLCSPSTHVQSEK